MEEGIDFEPTTEEESADVNYPIEVDNGRLCGPQGKRRAILVGEGKRQTYQGMANLSSTIRDRLWENRSRWGDGRSEYIPLINREIGQDSAVEEIRRMFLKAKTRDFFASWNEFDQVIVKLKTSNAKGYPLQIDGEVDPNLPKSIKTALGPSATQLAEKSDAENARNDEANREDRRILEDPQANEADRESASELIDQREQENAGLEWENDLIEEQMTLREKVKRIFRKYGVTVVGVALAAGAVIGAVVSALSRPLAEVARGVGNGLKMIRKKLGEILHGAVGAIVSFLFRAAGEPLAVSPKTHGC